MVKAEALLKKGIGGKALKSFAFHYVVSELDRNDDARYALIDAVDPRCLVLSLGQVFCGYLETTIVT